MHLPSTWPSHYSWLPTYPGFHTKTTKGVGDRGLEARDQQENGSDDDARAKFLEPMQDIMYIIDGPNTSNRKQKLEARDVYVGSRQVDPDTQG
jgi:hypothetical protein